MLLMIFANKTGGVVVSWNGCRPGHRTYTPTQARNLADCIMRRVDRGFETLDIGYWLLPFRLDLPALDALQHARQLCSAAFDASETLLRQRAAPKHPARGSKNVRT